MNECADTIKMSASGHFYPASLPTWLFRRLAGGLAWPSRGEAGFLVVLAESLDMDFQFNTRHIHLLHEQRDYGGQSFVNPEPLLRAAVAATDRFKVSAWFARPGQFERDIVVFNREQASLRQAQIRPIRLPGDPDLDYCVSLVRKRTYDQKTLHLGTQSEVMPALAALPGDLSASRFEDHPEVSALLMALAGLELLPDRGASGPRQASKRRVADPAAGY